MSADPVPDAAPRTVYAVALGYGLPGGRLVVTNQIVVAAGVNPLAWGDVVARAAAQTERDWDAAVNGPFAAGSPLVEVVSRVVERRPGLSWTATPPAAAGWWWFRCDARPEPAATLVRQTPAAMSPGWPTLYQSDPVDHARWEFCATIPRRFPGAAWAGPLAAAPAYPDPVPVRAADE
jgi:hypothetical protein